jgi:hypothetical protein
MIVALAFDDLVAFLNAWITFSATTFFLLADLRLRDKIGVTVGEASCEEGEAGNERGEEEREVVRPIRIASY